MTARLIHAALTSGVIIFAVISLLVLRPAMAEASMPPVVLGLLLALSLASSAFAVLVMRRRVPRRNTNESADLYWTTAATHALLTWAPLEAGALLGLVAHMLTGSSAALGVAAIALVGLIAVNPARLERA